MSLFPKIIELDENNKIKDSKLITISSSTGGGKTSLVHTMIYDYIKSGVNVIFFSETYNQSRSILFNLLDCLRLPKKTIGNLVITHCLYKEIIENFNNVISYHLKYLIGSTVIIVDGHMFDCQKSSFSYFFENTRFVIFEKINSEQKNLEFFIEKDENQSVNQHKIANSLRQISLCFNTHVIITLQEHNKFSGSIAKNVNTPFIFNSDICMSICKEFKNNIFSIKMLKNRSALDTGIKNCILNNNLLLEPIKNKLNLLKS